VGKSLKAHERITIFVPLPSSFFAWTAPRLLFTWNVDSSGDREQQSNKEEISFRSLGIDIKCHKTSDPLVEIEPHPCLLL
jgi:hypothetical protein